MKGYYVTNLNTNDKSGVSKKIAMQIDALRELGHTVELDSYYKTYRLRKLKALTTRLPLFPLSSKWEYRKKYDNAEFMYIRYPLADKWFINFLRKIKNRNPNIIIFVEIATFPYDGEAIAIGKKMRFLKDKSNRLKMKDYVDYIVTSSKYEYIYGIKTIRIENGIDVNYVPPVCYKRQFNGVTIATVSSLSFWQGFDRVIEGLKTYVDQGKEGVRFIVIGNGPEKKKLIELSDNYGLISKKIVIFKGELHGKELDDVFNEIDVGIGCIGLHRKKLTYVNTLKVREYCARGIPFVIANEEGGIDDSQFFVCKIEGDDRPVDIEKIVNFYRNVTMIPEYRIKVREYAKQNLSWKAQISKIMSTVQK